MNTILIAICGLFSLLWVFLILSAGKRYDVYITPLDSKEYALKSLFPVGFRILDLIRYKYNSKNDQLRLTQAKIVFGEKYGEFYYRVNMAEKYTYTALCVTLSPALGLIMDSPLFAGFGLFAGGITYYYADTKITDIIKKRELEISRDFADIVSKMALLINAGMITREAWGKIAETGEGTLYDEMRTAMSDMANGASEIDAYVAFGTRCGVPTIKKFISMLVQNLSKGNRELVEFLKAEAAIFWEEKKHIVRREGEKAGNKLMLPLSMILIGIFIMILVPIVTQIGL